MRLFGNAIQQYYGTLFITPPPGGTALTIAHIAGLPGLQINSTAPTTAVDIRNTSNGFQLELGYTASFAYIDASNATSGLALTTQGSANTRLSISNSGNVTIAAPSSGVALAVNGVAGQFTQTIQGSASAGNSNGLKILAGTNAADVALLVTNSANSVQFMQIIGTGAGQLGPSASLGLSWLAAGNVTIAAPSSGNTLTLSTVAGGYGVTISAASAGGGNAQTLFINSTNSLDNPFVQFARNSVSNGIIASIGTSGSLIPGSTANDFLIAGQTGGLLLSANLSSIALKITSAGNVTVNAPSSGSALTVNGSAGVDALTVKASSSSGNSFGAIISGGTTSADNALRVFNQATTVPFLQVFGDGGVTVGSPTGGDQGLGTLNATGLFVNGVAVGAGSTNGTFTGTMTGITGSPTSTGSYSVSGKTVTLSFAAQTGTSNATSFTITGLPAAIQPATGQYGSTNVGFTDNSVANKLGGIFVSAGGVATFYLVTDNITVITGGASNWTASGTKGFSGQLTFHYSLY
jgi:hypothetical protein